MTNSSNRSDFVGPILLAIFAYLASMLTRAFQRSIENTYAAYNPATREMGMNYTISDNFITDEKILQSLQNPQLWRDCDENGEGWWDGKSEPKNVFEQLSREIWKDRPEFIMDEVVGFEYWCNVLVNKKKLPWHIDKDEEELEKNKLVTPYAGAVYYGFNHDNMFDGGLLQLVDADIGDDPLQFESVRRDEVVEITPNFNRMVVFNASKWHKVSGVHTKSGSGPDGGRYTFAVNANKHVPKRVTDGRYKQSKWNK